MMRVNRRSALAATGLSAIALVLPAQAAEDGKAIKDAAQRFVDEVLNTGNLAVIDELFNESFEPTNPDDAAGREAYKSRLESKLQFDSIMVEGVKYEAEIYATKSPDVFVRGYVTGASSGGKKIKALFFLQLRFQDGLVISEWMLRDEVAMLGM